MTTQQRPKKRTTCPRCDAHLAQTYMTEFPGCVACGWEDYKYLIPKRERQQDALMSGLVSRLRYIGFADKLQDITVPIRVERDKSKVGVSTVPSCPYDHKDMRFIAGSGYRKRKKNERTYRCPARHRIVLLSSANGEWRGWM